MEVWCLSLAGLFIWLINTAKGEIRCHCNGASCVGSSYMCKSSQGCFSQLSYGHDSRSIHGCVESLAEEDRAVCQGDGDILRTRTGPDKEWPILMCCKEDMCNYMDTRSSGLDVNIYVNTRSNGSSGLTHSNPKSPTYGAGSDVGGRQRHHDVSQQDLWFKAAVIAVPIAGGFILILLVLLAVRMLRDDNKRHRQLLQLRRHRSLTKAQLYVADHFSYPCDHNTQQLLQQQQQQQQHQQQQQQQLQQHQHQHQHPHPQQQHHPQHPQQRTSQCLHSNDKQLKHVYKDVNITIDHTGQGYERMSDTSGPDGSCNSIIIWGKPGKAQQTMTPSAVV